MEHKTFALNQTCFLLPTPSPYYLPSSKNPYPPHRVLERLPCLETLSLRNNGLTALPDNIWSLPSLRALDLSDNDLPAEAILAPNPPPFASLKCLRWLGLAGNPRVSVRSGEDLERWRRALSAGPPSLHRLVVSGPGEEVLVWQRAAAWGPDGGAWRLHGWNGATGSPGALDR